MFEALCGDIDVSSVISVGDVRDPMDMLDVAGTEDDGREDEPDMPASDDITDEVVADGVNNPDIVGMEGVDDAVIQLGGVIDDTLGAGIAFIIDAGAICDAVVGCDVRGA